MGSFRKSLNQGNHCNVNIYETTPFQPSPRHFSELILGVNIPADKLWVSDLVIINIELISRASLIPFKRFNEAILVSF